MFIVGVLVAIILSDLLTGDPKKQDGVHKVMIKRSSAPTAMFWNAAGLSIVILSVSMFRATNFKLEAANNKLEVNRAVEQVKKVLDTSEQSTRHLPKQEKVKVQQDLNQAREKLEATQKEILSDEKDLETNKLTFIEGDL